MYVWQVKAKRTKLYNHFPLSTLRLTVSICRLFKGLVSGYAMKFSEAAIFSKTYKIMPKRIIYYSIDNHSARLQ